MPKSCAYPLFLLFCLLPLTIGFAKPADTYAVSPLDAIGITKDEAKVLTSALRSELISTANFKVLERDKMNEILTEQGFQQTGVCNETSCLVEMGQLLGVTQMIAGSIGKVGIAPPSWAGVNIARAVCRIVPGPEIDGHYLAMVLQSLEVQDYFRETTRTQAQPTLNVGQLEQTPIPVPETSEQCQIVTYLENLHTRLDALKGLQAETAAELDALLPSILDKAFKGEL